jgi:ADP-ribosylglycohydrolase
VAFLDSSDVEDAIRLAVSLGGDADTQAAIAGGIAEAFYRHVPETCRCRPRAVASTVRLGD